MSISDYAPALDLNPAVLASLSQDSAGSTPVTADGDPVGRFASQVGGLAFLQATSGSRPTYKPTGLNGHAALRYVRASTQGMTMTEASSPSLSAIKTGSYSVAMVASVDNTNQTQPVFGKDVFGGQRLGLKFNGSNTTGSIFNSTSTPFLNAYYSLPSGEYSLNTSLNTAYVIVYTYASTGTNQGTESIWINGVMCAQRSGSIAAWGTQDWVLGGKANPQAFGGDIGRLVVFPSALNADAVLDVSNELRTAYGLGAFQSNSLRITATGDSITYGPGATFYFQKEIIRRGGPANHNFSVSGDTLAAAVTAFPTREGYAIAAVPGTTAAWVIFRGTNDLGNTPAAGAGALRFNDLTTLINNGKAANPGLKVIVVTLLPKAGSANAQFEIERQDFNARVRAALISQTPAIDAIADWGNDPLMGQAGQASSLTYYNADGIHPNSAGHAIGSTYLMNAITSVLDTTPPVVPEGLANNQDGVLTLTWAENSDDTAGYEYRIDGGSAVDVGDVSSTLVRGLTNGEQYEVQLRAYDASGNRSAWSDAVTATPSADPQTGGGAGSFLGSSFLVGAL